MYAKYGRQMLSNRVISEGCRRVYPASTSGLYVPDELRQILKEDKKVEKDMGAAPVVDDDDAALREVEQRAAPGGNTPPSVASPDAAASGQPTRTRSDAMRDLCKRANVNMVDLLTKGGVQIAEDMTDGDWSDAKAMLERRAKKLEAAAQA